MLLTALFSGLLLSVSAQSSANSGVYEPLWLYNGTWKISKHNQKPDELLNQCALIGRYFACQQTVNGTPSELLIFVPAKDSGHYYTQSIRPDGRAGGRGDLQIEGDKWTYSSTWDEGGKSTFYRTLNTFAGKSHIHYEQQESSDKKDWKTTDSGDESLTSPGKRTVLR